MVEEQQQPWSLAQTQAFFSERAATWETKYGHDMPAYAKAVGQLPVPQGAVAIDVGCGTGRAMPALRDAVGPKGAVIGFDVTSEMLEMAVTLGRRAYGALVLGDANRLPLSSASVDVVFAAGLLGHVAQADVVLAELARVARPGAHLALFHPVSRAALATRRGRTLSPDDLLAQPVLRGVLDRTGWRLETYDDAEDRFFAAAQRREEYAGGR
ncbi:MAG TPA: class I SAM-dependent methyltransferase [Micromonosporaceae bacterium]